MLCSECHLREATVRVTTDIDGVKRVHFLCPVCAQKLNHIAAEGISGAFSQVGGVRAAADRDKVCRSCGTRMSDFARTGYVGCENCYREFEPEMSRAVARVQGTERHRGKFPKSCANYALRAEYEGLAEELKRAKDEDRFEDAMRIYNRMNEIRAKLER